MRRTTGVLVAVVALGRAAAAQETPSSPVGAGSVIRVTVLPAQRVIGTVVSANSDTIVLMQRGVSLRLPTASVAKLEVGYDRARTTPTLIGAALGALVGGVLGGAVSSTSSNDNGQSADYVGSETAAATGTLFGAAGGALLGGIAGFNWPRWRWREVPPPRLGVVPDWRGVGVTIGF